MYHVAAKFTGKEKAGSAYTELESTLKQLKFYAHVSRLILGDDWYVSLIYDGEEEDVPLNVKMEIARILKNGGTLTYLPEETIATIQQRRANRRAQGIGTFESHDPTAVTSRVPVLRDAETKEELAMLPQLTEIVQEESYKVPVDGSPIYRASLKDLPPELRAQAKQMQAEIRQKAREKARPFFIRYRSHVEKFIQEEDEFDLLMTIYLEQVKGLTPYLFTGSAIKLLRAVYSPEKDDFPIPDSDIWIEFSSPVETPGGMIRAFIIAQVNRETVLEQVERKSPGLKGIRQVEQLQDKDLYRIQALDDDMQIVATVGYDASIPGWVYHAGSCQTKQCAVETKRGHERVAQPCDDCVKRNLVWASLARTVLLIVGREYAVSPEPEPWGTQVQSWEEEGAQKVGKGKNAHVIRVTRKREVEYRLVTFDVSVPPARTTESQHVSIPEEEKRANWLTLASKDQIIYKRMHFEDITRHYSQHKRLLERCKSAGGKLTAMDGNVLREYQVETRPDGSEIVVSKIVPFVKYVPMLREKKPTIRKVVASSYEKEGSK